MSTPHAFSRLTGLLIVLALLAACIPATPETPTPTSEPSPTASPLPPRKLTVCLGAEPASLFPLGNLSSTARSVLAAVYDGPIDSNSYGYQAVILDGLPSLENGDAQIFPVSAYVGNEVVDASGQPVTLTQGVRLRPAGCRSDSCAIEYDGRSQIQMDQMQVTFRLLPGLTWSDGEPLTAADSVFAYQYSASPSTTVSKYLVARTYSYEAADDLTVQWWGKPGFVDPSYQSNFWMPLPAHTWSQFATDSLADTDEAARAPLGWGPFVIQEWVEGDHIRLVRNPRYFRAAEGLPRFDVLTFRFVPDPQTALQDLADGTCDILDPSVPLDGLVGELQTRASQGLLQALFTSTPVMEELAFGIRPTAYDNGYNATYDRPDFFGDARTRQAVALCLDRQAVVGSLFPGLTSVPNTFLPADHPLYDPTVHSYSMDVAAANALLEAVGWRDLDHDPATPREAWGVPHVPSATRFVVDYLTTGAAQRQQAAGILAASLAQCGIQVNIKTMDASSLYAQGPDGPLFGRSFSLAEFAMGSTGSESICAWFTTPEIPSAANHWIGTNVSGYSSPAFDSACQTARQSLPGEASFSEAYQQAQTLFAEELPVIPLYWRVKAAAARPGLCHFALDPTAASPLWNIEAFDSGQGCLP
jgi:peptide/nickel transport system substrate-binding protein